MGGGTGLRLSFSFVIFPFLSPFPFLLSHLHFASLILSSLLSEANFLPNAPPGKALETKQQI